VREVLTLPGANHFTACEELARADSPLFEATVALCKAARE
jgi:hypothetical protein